MPEHEMVKKDGLTEQSNPMVNEVLLLEPGKHYVVRYNPVYVSDKIVFHLMGALWKEDIYIYPIPVVSNEDNAFKFEHKTEVKDIPLPLEPENGKEVPQNAKEGQVN